MIGIVGLGPLVNRNKAVCAKKRGRFFAFDNFLGESDWTKRIRRRIVQSSNHRFNAYISGPAGSGKRLVARSLHEHGSDEGSPFIPVDCSQLNCDFFRTQMFGKAYLETTTLGCLRSANGGTIYLANVEQLGLPSQRALLEVLESGRVVPTDSQESHDFDVRFVVGSRKNLEQLVRDGHFLVELFRRLCVVPFETEPLRSRPGDILPIANHLIAKLTFERGVDVKSLTGHATTVLASYEWPGNVTELQEALDDAIQVSGNDPEIDVCHLPLKMGTGHSWSTLADVEAMHIRNTVEVTGGDVELAAGMLGITREELEARMDAIS